MTEQVSSNVQLVLVAGESGVGKSASLRNIRNQERWAYLNCEAGKRLPFRNKFMATTITDPAEVINFFTRVGPGGEYADAVDGVIIDSATMLMDLYEMLYVKTAKDTQQAWGNYGDFYRQLLQVYVARFGKPVIIIGHNESIYDENKMEWTVKLGIKGAVGRRGGEAFFSTAVNTKKVKLEELAKYQSDLLHITEEDEMLGYKHVFQTKPTKETTNERMRSPMGMFEINETFIDNDVQLLLDHLNDYYGFKDEAAA